MSKYKTLTFESIMLYDEIEKFTKQGWAVYKLWKIQETDNSPIKLIITFIKKTDE